MFLNYSSAYKYRQQMNRKNDVERSSAECNSTERSFAEIFLI